jgi:hypothetical protein
MKIKHALLGLAAAFSFSASAFAAPILFNISTMTVTPGVGYGVDSENLLDVAFTPAAAPGSFSLDLAGIKTKTFNVSGVELKEICVNPGSCPKPADGNGNETMNLNVGVTFHFINPFTGDQSVTLLGSANPGPVDDGNAEPKKDYWLDFTAQEFTFGNGGKFSIDLSDLTFNGLGSQTLTATITLVNAPAAVPEPASLALVGLGLAGLAARGKRRKA